MRLLFATRNSHKTREICQMLGAGFDVVDLTAFPGSPEVEETGTTFLENAELKAVAGTLHFPGLVLSDDSGLEVDVMGGAPGVFSARYAGAGAEDAANRAKLIADLRSLGKQPDGFAARFRCCMVVARNGKVLASFDGAVEGRIVLEESGTGGFGYDPLFVPDGFENTFAELPAEIKNTLSHRARALEKAAVFLKKHAQFYVA